MAVMGLEQVKQGARAGWAAGDYPAIAQRQLWPVGERIVRRAAVGPADDVLDVACGTGNAALRAAQAGARVVGVDLTPELLDEAAAGSPSEARRRGAVARGRRARRCRSTTRASTSSCRCSAACSRLATAWPRRSWRGCCDRAAGWPCAAWTPGRRDGRVLSDARRTSADRRPISCSRRCCGDRRTTFRDLFADTGVELEFAREFVEFPRMPVDDEIEFATSKFGPADPGPAHARAAGSLAGTDRRPAAAA